jgi:hypothetical protein
MLTGTSGEVASDLRMYADKTDVENIWHGFEEEFGRNYSNHAFPDESIATVNSNNGLSIYAADS